MVKSLESRFRNDTSRIMRKYIPIINNVVFKSVSEIFIAYARMEVSPFGGGKTSGYAAILYSRHVQASARIAVVL